MKKTHKYDLYWTPCAAHCINLIFEDIGKKETVVEVIAKARQLTNYIYNNGWLLALMREMCRGDIVRPGATRFATNYKVAEQEYLDLVDITDDENDEKGNSLFQWVRPAHLDDNEGNSDPKIAAMTRDYGINVNQVLQKEVGNIFRDSKTDSSTEDGENSDGGNDGSGRNDDGSENGVKNQDDYGLSHTLLSPFSCEANFTHATQDMDHGSRGRGSGIGAIGKEYIRRHAWTQEESPQTDIEELFANLDSTNMGSTDHSDMSQDSYASYTYRSSQIDWTTQNVYQQNNWVNGHYPIHGEAVGINQETYQAHVHNYIHNYSNVISWYQYYLEQDDIPSTIFEPHRSSFWY